MNNHAFTVSVTAAFEAETADDAARQFRQWWQSGHRTVFVVNDGTGEHGDH